MTGQLLNLRYMVCRDTTGTLRGGCRPPLPAPLLYICSQLAVLHLLATAFHVCRHHVAPVARGAGTCKLFRCEYHGWAWVRFGRPPEESHSVERLKDFAAKAYGLVPMQAATWVPFIFVKAGNSAATQRPTAPEAGSDLAVWLGLGGVAALEAGVALPRRHVATRSYDLRCN